MSSYEPGNQRCISFVSDWNLLVLKSIFRLSYSPTKTSRILFMWSSMCQSASCYNNLESMLPGSANIRNSTDQWLDACCSIATKKILYYLNSFDKCAYDTVFNSHNNILNISIVVSSKYGIDYGIYVDKYLTIRDTDNSLISDVLSSNNPRPNPGYFNVALNNKVYDISKWTPLIFDGKIHPYLSPEWGNVTGILETTTFNSLLASAQQLYPSNEQYMAEVEDVLVYYNSLVDTEKMMAEFWAGGPSTVTPPGIWNIITNSIMNMTPLLLKDQINIYHYVNAALFQASIMAWKLKRDNMQGRPIQIIRLTLDQDWLPYQPTKSLSPPFPDFVSGHSTFSAAASIVLQTLFGTDFIGNVKIKESLLPLISPIFKDKRVQSNLNNIYVFPHTSAVDISPTIGCFLGRDTLSGFTEEAGISRIYGGIHVMSSNCAGLLLGSGIGSAILDKY